MGGRVIAASFVGLLVGFVGGAAAAWGLDPGGEPERALQVAGGRADFVVFLEQDVPDAEVAVLETRLRADPRISRIDFMDTQESREEYRRIFADNEAMLDRIEESPDLLPTSFRFSVLTTDHAVVEDIMAAVDRTDAVLRVMATLSTAVTLDPGEPIRWE